MNFFQVKYYTIQIDSTQDNTSIDLFSLIIQDALKDIICARGLSCAK